MILDVKLYSLTEAAELLGVTRATISSYIKSGRLNASLIGGKKYVSEENLKQFLHKSES